MATFSQRVATFLFINLTFLTLLNGCIALVHKRLDNVRTQIMKRLCYNKAMKLKANEEKMLAFAKRLGGLLQAQDVIVLTGELGAGKTTFVKGLALGLDIQQMIKSPTYTIVREYEQGKLPLYHMDVYRVGDDPDSFDLDDYLFGEGVSVIEWGELLGKDLPDDYLEVQLDKYAEGFATDAQRELELIPHGQRYENLLGEL